MATKKTQKKDDELALYVVTVPLAIVGVFAIYMHYWGKKLGASG
jgi:hypothetical protein